VDTPDKFQQDDLAEEALHKTQVDEDEEDLEADQLQQMEDELERQRAEEEAKIVAMDILCVERFLEAVTMISGRDPVGMPLKGIDLYTNHMCQLAGINVDVEDSSFGCLDRFLLFLEEEGVLRLQPGVADPVITEVDCVACSNYKYDPWQRVTTSDVPWQYPYVHEEWFAIDDIFCNVD
jgi:hypothetical protein